MASYFGTVPISEEKELKLHVKNGAPTQDELERIVISLTFHQDHYLYARCSY